jgi:hypothetical protein
MKTAKCAFPGCHVTVLRPKRLCPAHLASSGRRMSRGATGTGPKRMMGSRRISNR